MQSELYYYYQIRCSFGYIIRFIFKNVASFPIKGINPHLFMLPCDFGNFLNFIIQRKMPIICCPSKPQEIIQHDFSVGSEFQIEPCLLHGKRVQFVCTDKTCEQNNNTLLCDECLKEHRHHEWKTKDQYFTRSFKSIMDKKVNLSITDVLQSLKQSFHNQLEKSVTDVYHEGIEKILRELAATVEEMELEYSDKVDRKRTQRQINSDNFQEMKNFYDEQKFQIGRIKEISEILTKSLIHLGASLKKMLDLLNLQVQFKSWLNHEAMVRFEDEIEQYDTNGKAIEEEKNYFHFTPLLKHDNIKLESTNRAIYHYCMPSKPVAMASNSIVVNHNKFGMEIIKMESKAFFFQNTTIFIGVCNEEIVKIAGMRKINEQSKGSYLISSAGWSYHHKDENYNRTDNVGWTFGEGDRIEIQVVFDRQLRSTSNTKIIFKKIGRFFDSLFEMPLRLTNEQLRKLKPCVSFDAEVGAVVKIYDIQ